MRSDLPSGTVTFLFTDVEGSTRLLHSLGAEGYADALAEHRRVVREACAVLEGDYEEAAQLLRLAIQFAREIQGRWAGELLGLASVIGAHHGRKTKAAKLLGALDAHRDRIGHVMLDDHPVDRVIATTGQALDEAGFGWARAEGRGLLFEEMLDLACEAAGLTTEANPP